MALSCLSSVLVVCRATSTQQAGIAPAFTLPCCCYYWRLCCWLRHVLLCLNCDGCGLDGGSSGRESDVMAGFG